MRQQTLNFGGFRKFFGHFTSESLHSWVA